MSGQLFILSSLNSLSLKQFIYETILPPMAILAVQTYIVGWYGAMVPCTGLFDIVKGEP